MTDETNYLLGYGERLTEPIDSPQGGGPKRLPYTLSEARDRIEPKLRRVCTWLDAIPNKACPRDEAVALLTLHPQFLAKSYYPTHLLRKAGLTPVGSRARKVTPEKWTRAGKPEPMVTAEIFVAAPRRAFRQWSRSLKDWDANSKEVEDLRKIEEVRILPLRERKRRIPIDIDNPFLEIVLHASSQRSSGYILSGFEDYIQSLDLPVDLSSRVHAGGLCFLPVRVPSEMINEAVKFSFLRVAREMPRLYLVQGVSADPPTTSGFRCSLPTANAVDKDIKVAVFDGGIPPDSGLGHWVNRKKIPGLGTPGDEGPRHGVAVTSALLFGPVQKGHVLPLPYAKVDHWRVTDKDTETPGSTDQPHYYSLLKRIQSILARRKYDFLNFSIGARVPVEDDVVDAWTAVMDQYLATGDTLATFAVGNEGLEAPPRNRIQPPSDSVNGLAIGACDCMADSWHRAEYSSVGPGRSPGFVKPDAIAFGGVKDETPFWVLDADAPGFTRQENGTSFAAPAALRIAIGIRAHFGPVFGPLALRAMLLHHCEANGQCWTEIGRGRLPEYIDDIVTCGDSTVHVVYQGFLDPAQFLRAYIPVPASAMKGKVTIKATLCYATDTDPADPVHYTKAGVDVVFRPDMTRRKQGKKEPVSESFFGPDSEFATEQELRTGAFKWETTRQAEKRKYGSKLNDPVLDIHYIPREAGRPTSKAAPIPYALVVTVEAPRHPDLYNDIVVRYKGQLEIVRPTIQLPIRART